MTLVSKLLLGLSITMSASIQTPVLQASQVQSTLTSQEPTQDQLKTFYDQYMKQDFIKTGNQGSVATDYEYNKLGPMKKKEVKELYLKSLSSGSANQTTTMMPAITSQQTVNNVNNNTQQSNLAQSTINQTTTRPLLLTKEGCEDALNKERYSKDNFDATMRKVNQTHSYDGRQGTPSGDGRNSKFNIAIIKNFDSIKTMCTYKKVVRDTSNRSPGAVCYFTCSKDIGINKNGQLVNTVMLGYKYDNQESDKYYLFSVYPAPKNAS